MNLFDNPKSFYTLYTDGECCPNPGNGSWSYVLFNDNEKIIEDFDDIEGTSTCNEAEYCGLINGLQACLDREILEITVLSDSKMCVNQLNGLWRVKKDHLKPLHSKAIDLMRQFGSIEVCWIPRDGNLAHRD